MGAWATFSMVLLRGFTMINHIALGLLPPSENRINPRVVKKKMSNSAKKRAAHYRLPQPQAPFERSIVNPSEPYWG